MTLLSSPNFVGLDAAGVDVGVVDWVLVEVRAAPVDTSPANFGGDTVTVQIPALLLSNGLVVDAVKFFGDGLDDAARTACATSGGSCNDADVEVPAAAFPPDRPDVRIVIRHRNHLDVMSSNVVVQKLKVVNFADVDLTNV